MRLVIRKAFACRTSLSLYIALVFFLFTQVMP